MKQRVLMLCQRFPTLSETFVLSQIEGLADSLTSVIAEQIDWDLAREMRVEQELHSLEPKWPRPGKLQQPWLKLRWMMQRRRSGHATGWPPDVQDRLVNLIEQQRPDVLLIQYGHIAAWSYPALARTGVPYVIHFHGIDASAQLRHADYTDSLAVILPRAKGVIVVSRSMKARLESSVRGARTEVVPCGVPVPSLIPRRDFHTDRCRLLAVGRLVEKKGPLQTLEALARARETATATITLDMVGGGPLLEQVIERVRRLDLEDCVAVHGPQPNSFVKQLMNDADLFVQHSVVAANGDREGSPVAIMEASALGLPVVATKHEGICDLVIEGETGFLVDEHNVAGMAERIAYLADRPDLRQEMSAAAHQHARNELNSTQYLSRLRAVLGLEETL